LPTVRILDGDPAAWKGALKGLSKMSAGLLETLWLANAPRNLLDFDGDMVASLRQLD
jgi:hypothetical protein